jgi:hypothetical protein
MAQKWALGVSAPPQGPAAHGACSVFRVRLVARGTARYALLYLRVFVLIGALKGEAHVRWIKRKAGFSDTSSR